MARLYSTLFAPELFMLLCGIIVIAYESQTTETIEIDRLILRFGVLALGWGLAFLTLRALPKLFPVAAVVGTDLLASLGVGVALSILWLTWRWRHWGRYVPEFAELLFVVTAVHFLITLMWAISSHVMYTVAPAGYLSMLDRRFRPFMVIPIGMVVSRPLVGAHSWAQSIAGFVVAGLLVGGYDWYRTYYHHG